MARNKNYLEVGLITGMLVDINRCLGTPPGMTQTIPTHHVTYEFLTLHSRVAKSCVPRGPERTVSPL